MIYMEQTSHHPPVSHFLIEGPENQYKLHGWSLHSVHAGMNSATLKAQGFKEITFRDGHKIRYNNTGDYIFSIFMGNMGHQLTGRIEFEDEQNGIYGWYEPGTFKMKTQDYVTGRIEVNGRKEVDIYGNYMGFVDFNKQRYWDIRDMDQVWFPIEPIPTRKSLESDSLKRIDSITLKTRTVPEAQTAKEQLEEIQRHDRRLREAAEKRREEGGPKI